MKRPVCPGAVVFLVAVAWPLTLAAQEQPPTLPAGSTLRVRLVSTLSSKTSENGDPFMAEVEDPIFSAGQEVVTAGSKFEGHVSFVREPGRAKGVAEMRLTPEKVITASGIEFEISATLDDIQGAEGVKVKGNEGVMAGPGKSTKDTAKNTGIGAAAGAGVGAMGAGGAGALYGAAIGATAGVLRSVLKHHKDIVVPSGAELTFTISRTVEGKKAASQPFVVPN